MPVLHWSPRSPYVRKVLIALHENGLAEQVTRVRTPVDPMVPLQSFMGTNPLLKIPTLELEDSQVLFDSHVICRWADRNGKHGPILFPKDLMAERDEALGTGLIDIAFNWVVEARMRPPELRSDAMIAAYRAKMTAVLDWLETQIAQIADRPFDIGHLSIGAALCYLDFRFAIEDWQRGRAKLSAWHAEFRRRDSVQATQFQDEPRPT